MCDRYAVAVVDEFVRPTAEQRVKRSREGRSWKQKALARKGVRQKEARSSAQALGTSTTFNHARNRTEMPPVLQSRRVAP